MAAVSTIISGVGLVAGVAGQVRQRQAQRRQNAAMQRSADLQEEQQVQSTRRSRRQAIREAQVIRARALSAGAATGGLQGTGIAGGVSSLGSQLGSELGFSTYMSGLSRGINAANSEAARYGGMARNAAGMSSLGFGVFRNFGGMDRFFGPSGMFSGSRSPQPQMAASPMLAYPYSTMPQRNPR